MQLKIVYTVLVVLCSTFCQFKLKVIKLDFHSCIPFHSFYLLNCLQEFRLFPFEFYYITTYNRIIHCLGSNYMCTYVNKEHPMWHRLYQISIEGGNGRLKGLETKHMYSKFASCSLHTAYFLLLLCFLFFFFPTFYFH